MKRKLFLLMMVLFMGLTSMKAQIEVVIGSGSTTNSYMPTYELYNYSLSQQIYTAEEIGMGGLINSISFYYASTYASTRDLTIYLKHTTMSSMTTGTTWETVAASDIVFSGNVTYPGSAGWITFTLNAPFSYNGMDNLLVCVDDNSGTWVSSSNYYVYSTNRSKSIYSDGTNYDPYNASAYSGTARSCNNQIKLDMTVADAPIIAVTPNPIEMGPRPNGAWMRPVEVSVSNMGLPANLAAIDVDDDFFILSDMEFPMALNYGETVDFQIATGETAAGNVNASLVVMYNQRTIDLIDLSATAYDPVCPDVWELAQVVNNYPYTNTPSNIYDNYLLPGNVQDGPDAVYKMTFAQDMLLTGNVVGENGKMALYAEGFGGEGGPGATNNYTAPTGGGGGGGGGAGDEFSFDFETGTLEGWTLIDADGDGINWMNSGDVPLDLGSGHNGSDYCVISQSYDNSTGVLYPDNYLVSPEKVSIVNGSSLSFYACGQDAMYAGEHYGVAISTTGNTNAADFTTIWQETLSAKGGSPAKGPRGTREQGNWYLKTIDLSAYAGQEVYIALRHFNVSDMYFLDVDDITLTAGRANRDDVTLLEEGFEGGAIPTGWTKIASSSTDWYVADYSDYGNDPAHTGTYAAFCNGESYAEDYAYLVSPAIDLTEATAASLNYYYMNKSWGGDINGALVYYGTSATGPWTNLWSTYSGHSDWTNNTIDLAALCGGTYYLAFASEDNYGYCTGFDDITLTATMAGPAGNLIENMTVAAGTYYLAASSTEAGFEVQINATAIPLPEPPVCVAPADGASEIESPVTLRWELGEYTTQYQLLMGTSYPPTEVMVDWTGNLASSFTTGTLLNNKNYFWRVNEKNTTGTTTGTVWGFTTSLNVPQDLVVADNELFEGENAEFSWTAVNDRSHRGYNFYQDGVKINVNTIITTNYTVEGLAYNMAPGYTFAVTAVYDEGESPISNEVRVFVSGNGTVSGIVYEQDGTTTVEGATVTFRGEDEFGDNQEFAFNTGANGAYSGDILAGVYGAVASKTGYQDAAYDGDVEIIYANETPDININLTENFNPVGEVIAEEVDDNMVKVYWSWDMMSVLIEDFETGDFNANPWDNTISSYPWAITTTNPYEGTYCMKSTCENVDYGSSAIQITVEVPYNGLMSFYQLISSEQNYDKGHFYIDGVEKATASGSSAWTYKEFDVTEGEHTYKWEYTKDVSLGSGSDCYFIDYVTFYQQPEPWPGEGWIFYDDGTNVDAVGLTAGGSFYWGIMFPTATLQQYGNFSLTKVGYFDYTAHTGTILIYEGGDAAPGTLIHSQAYTAGGTNAYIEFDLTSALPINNTQNLWIVMNNNDGQYVASACGDTGDPNGRWISLDGTTWDDIVALGLSYTWNLRGFITNARGQVMALSTATGNKEIAYEGQSTPGGILTTDPNAKTTVTNFGMNRGYDRSFNSYKLYRTNCYNEDYTVENTEVLASHITDTVYMDMSWANAEPGVYKWGVAAYYAGNRSASTGVTTSVPSETTEVSGIAVETAEPTRAAWDLMHSFSASEAAQYGVATDGQNIYMCNWGYASASYNFFKYDLQGNFIEGFNVAGCGTIRDLDYDGQYFYGGANSSTLYCIDLANKQLVSTTATSCSGIRHCSYDPVNDGFWVGGWSDLKLISRQGATITTAPAPSSCGGTGYYTAEDGSAHLYLWCEPTYLYDYDIASNTIVGMIQNLNQIPGWDGSSTVGGCYIGEYNGKIAFFGAIQQNPNLVGIYELKEATTPGPGGNGLQEPGESPIVWSNCLDKDMITTLDVTVATNSGDAPTGASVSFVNISEPDMAISYDVELDETGMYAWSEVRKGTYLYTIELDGYTSCATADTIVIWEPTSVECVLEEVINTAGNLYVSPTGWAMWDGTGGPIPAGGFLFQQNEMVTHPGQGAGGADASAICGESAGAANFGPNVNWALGGGSYYLLADDFVCESNATINFMEFYGYQTGSGNNSTMTGLYIQIYDGNPMSGGQVVWGDNNTNLLSSTGWTNIYRVSVAYTGLTDSNRPIMYLDANDLGIELEAGTYWIQVGFTGSSSSGPWGAPRCIWDEAESGNGLQKTDAGWTMWTDGGQKGLPMILSSEAPARNGIAMTANPVMGFGIAASEETVNDNFEVTMAKDLVYTPVRGFEYYKVMLDGVFAADVTTNYYQHDVTNLVEGQEYTTTVAAMYATGMSAWSEYTWTYVPCENFNGVTDLTGEPENGTAVLNWTMPNGGPTPPPGGGDTFFYDFEDGSLGDWTTIDADGDGKNWLLGSAPGVSGNNGSSYCAYSQSYDSAPLTPDNYLVSKQVTIGAGATFEFYACGQDASYAAEHYGVAISTSGNTNAADFTTIWEETMTAKGQQGGPRGNRVQGTWYHKSIDLSAYAGQQVYIALRHFNCTDMFYLDVDDIELTCASKATLDGTWLSYDDGTFVDGIGTGGSEVFWAVMFPSTMMSAYEGYSMTKVNMYDKEAFTGDVMIYQGGATAPGTLVYTQEITMSGTSADVDIVLNEAVALDVTQNVWVVMHCDFGGWPASAGADTGDPNGRWISLDGTEWMDVAAAGVPGFCWTLRAYVEEGGIVPPTPTGTVIGAMVFRNGELLTPAPINASTYTDATPDAGVNEYCVRVVYGEEEFGEGWYAMSCPECVEVEFGACAAPEDLFGEYTWNEDGTYGATLTWPYDGPTPPTPGEYATIILEAHDVWGDGTGYQILLDSDCNTSANITGNFTCGQSYADYEYMIPENATAGDENVVVNGTMTIEIPAGTYDYVVLNPGCASFGVVYVASDQCDPSIGQSVTFAAGQTYHFTATLVSPNDCITITNSKGLDFSNLTPRSEEFAASVKIANEQDLLNRAVRNEIDHFNIYRSTTNGNYALIGEAPANASTYFDDCTGSPDVYYYQVTAVYTDGCESEPANAYANPADNYVMVDVTSVIENNIDNARIYPNPTSDKLNIEAAGMTRITVTTVLGQVMLDQAVNSDNEVLDMNQYGAGVYMVRIVTENGTMVKRITVID